MDSELELEGEGTHCLTSRSIEVVTPNEPNEPEEDGIQETQNDTNLCEIEAVPIPSTSQPGTYVSAPIVKLCADILSRFNTMVQPDDFINKEIQKFEPMYGEYELYYLVELFFGVLDRINCIINIIVTFRNSSLSEGLTWTEADTCELEVLSYIIFFTAKDVYPKYLHEVFVSYSWKGAKQFYRFVVSSACMDSSLMLAILDVYAVDYVEAIILSNVRCALTALKAAFCSRGNEDRKESKLPRNTVVEPFSFSEVQPRSPPTPKLIPPPYRASRVPYSTHHAPRPSRRLEAEYEKNRFRGSKNIVTLIGLERKSRIYHEEDKSCQFYRKLTSIKVERKNDLERSKYTPSRIPLNKVLKEPKLKAGTTYSELLRQKQLCFNEKQAELHALNNIPFLETGIEVEERELQLRRENEEHKAMDLEKKKMEAKLTFQKAIAARRKLQDVKREQVDEYKEEINRMLKGKVRADEIEELEMLTMKVKAWDENETQKKKAALKAAKEKAAKERKFRKEKMEMLKKRDTGRSEERRKRDLVQKIRASRIKPIPDQQNGSHFSAYTETQMYLIKAFMQNRWMKEEIKAEVDSIKCKKYQANKEAEKRKELMKAEIDDCRRRKTEKKQFIDKEKSIYQPTQDELSSPALNALKSELEAITLENHWARGKY